VKDLTQLSVREIVAKLAEKEISSEQLVQGHLDRIEQTEDRLGSFLALSNVALRDARESDMRRRADENFSGLDGVPIAIKDVLCT